MSSILDALKKVEEESIHTSGLRSRIPQGAGTGDRVRFFLVERAIILAFAAGLIGLGAGGYWAYHNLPGAPAATRTAPVVESTPQTAEASRPRLAEPGAGIPAPVRTFAEKPEPVAPPATADTPPAPEPPQMARHLETSNPQAAGPLMQTPAPAAPLYTPAPAIPEDQRTPEAPVKPRPHEVQSRVEVPRESPETPPAPAQESPPVLEESGLTLQAISWASRPEDRIAVINGKICREGEKIAGFAIRQINPDDVRVADGKNTWRLVFRIK